MPAPVSTRFKQTILDSYKLVSKVEVIGPGGQILADSGALNVIGGRINVDASASFRRWISDLTLVDSSGLLVPTTAADIFSPVAGNELVLYVGAEVDGVPEYVKQGVFFLEGCRTEDSPGGLQITLSAYDRGRRYSRGKMIVPKRFLAVNATYIYAAITDLLDDVINPTYVLHDSPVYMVPDQVYDAGTDPWETARELAESMGYELWFDRDGNCRLTQVMDPNSPNLQQHWTYAEGPGSGLLRIIREQSNAEAYNGQIVYGENSSNSSPVRDIATDDDINSPTRWGGSYGKVPEFWQSDKIRTVQQAHAAAVGRLNQRKGLTEVVTFACVPNPAMEPGDVVELIRSKSKLNAGSYFVADRYQIPLGAADGEMVVTCRQRRLV